MTDEEINNLPSEEDFKEDEDSIFTCELCGKPLDDEGTDTYCSVCHENLFD